MNWSSISQYFIARGAYGKRSRKPQPVKAVDYPGEVVGDIVGGDRLAESVGGVDERDPGLPGALLILMGIADVDGLLDAIPVHQGPDGDVLALLGVVEAHVVEESVRPNQRKESLDIAELAIGDYVQPIPEAYQLLQGRFLIRIKLPRVLEEVFVFRLEKRLPHRRFALGALAGEYRIDDLVHRLPHLGPRIGFGESERRRDDLPSLKFPALGDFLGRVPQGPIEVEYDGRLLFHGLIIDKIQGRRKKRPL